MEKEEDKEEEDLNKQYAILDEEENKLQKQIKIIQSKKEQILPLLAEFKLVNDCQRLIDHYELLYSDEDSKTPYLLWNPKQLLMGHSSNISIDELLFKYVNNNSSLLLRPKQKEALNLLVDNFTIYIVELTYFVYTNWMTVSQYKDKEYKWKLNTSTAEFLIGDHGFTSATIIFDSNRNNNNKKLTKQEIDADFLNIDDSEINLVPKHINSSMFDGDHKDGIKGRANVSFYVLGLTK